MKYADKSVQVDELSPSVDDYPLARSWPTAEQTVSGNAGCPGPAR